MKKFFLGFIATALALSFFSACQKEATNTTNTDLLASISEYFFNASQDIATSQAIELDDEAEIENQLETALIEARGVDCVTRTWSAPKGTFPNTLTIDFGTEGCKGKDGEVRKGKIIVTMSDSLRVAGATRTTIFENYFVGGAKVEGSHTIKNNGNNSISKSGNTKITTPAGKIIETTMTETIKQTAGIDTKRRNDDSIEITGSRSGTTRDGKTFSTTILSPLVKTHNCRWISSGKLELVLGDNKRTIDYGDGSCDRFGTVTTPDGKSRTILLANWW